MRDLILEVKAEAERELLLAQAKVEVANSLLAKCDERFRAEAVCEDTEGATEYESVETENIDGDTFAV
jgi:hypothetical protein